jgi:hypothetical protein
MKSEKMGKFDFPPFAFPINICPSPPNGCYESKNYYSAY